MSLCLFVSQTSIKLGRTAIIHDYSTSAIAKSDYFVTSHAWFLWNSCNSIIFKIAHDSNFCDNQ